MVTAAPFRVPTLRVHRVNREAVTGVTRFWFDATSRRSEVMRSPPTSELRDSVANTRIVHLIRYSMPFASWKQSKSRGWTLKAIYFAALSAAG